MSGLVGRLAEEAREPLQEGLRYWNTSVKVVSSNSESHRAWVCPGRQPSVNLRSKNFVLSHLCDRACKRSYCQRDLVDVAARQRPYHIVGWDHPRDEPFQLTQRDIIRHYPNADPRIPVAGVFEDDSALRIRCGRDRGNVSHRARDLVANAAPIMELDGIGVYDYTDSRAAGFINMVADVRQNTINASVIFDCEIEIGIETFS